MDAIKKITLSIDRSSVCAGDDVEPHAYTLSVRRSMPIGELIEELSESYLAKIFSGRATWLVHRVTPKRYRCFGVLAQQWTGPRLLVNLEAPVDEVLPERSLFFEYRGQSDPAAELSNIEKSSSSLRSRLRRMLG